MVKIGRTKTTAHGDLSERNIDAKSHPTIYLTLAEVESGIDTKVGIHAAIAAAHHTKTVSSDIDHALISNVLASQHHEKGIKNVAIGSGTRNASGSQTISGLGFQPKIVLFIAFATGGTNQILSQGYDDASVHYSVSLMGNTVDAFRSLLQSIWVQVDADNYMGGHITSMNADGFVIDWGLTGSVTVNFIYLAMR